MQREDLLLNSVLMKMTMSLLVLLECSLVITLMKITPVQVNSDTVSVKKMMVQVQLGTGETACGAVVMLMTDMNLQVSFLLSPLIDI